MGPIPHGDMDVPQKAAACNLFQFSVRRQRLYFPTFLLLKTTAQAGLATSSFSSLSSFNKQRKPRETSGSK